MKIFQLPIDWLSYCFARCILMGTVMRDDTSQHPHRLAATQPVRPIATTTWSPRIAGANFGRLTGLPPACEYE